MKEKNKKSEKKRKIFHGMSDVSGQASNAVKGLIINGQDASLTVWRKNYFHYSNCFCLNIGKNKLFYPYYAIKIFGYGIYAMFRYDIFHFHFGYSLFPFNLDLFFLKKLGKTVFMEYHGDDIRYAFYRKKPQFYYFSEIPPFSYIKKRTICRTFQYTDQFILHDAELLKHFPNKNKKIFYVPLKIEMEKFEPAYPAVSCKKPVIVHAPSDPLAKGSPYISKAIHNLKQKYNFEFIMVKNKTQKEAITIYKKADIVIDQLFAGTYGVFAIEAMALGKPVIAYLTEEMKEQFPDELPIVNATILSIETIIEKLLLDSRLRYELGVKGRKYAEDYHDYKVAAKELINIYEGKADVCSQKEAFARMKNLKRD